MESPGNGRAVNIRETQRIAWGNKVTKGFNVSDTPLEFMLAHGELAEALTAWRRGEPGFGEELADVLLYVFGLAQTNGIDMETEIQRKLAKNAARHYTRDDSGVLIKVATDSTET